MRTRMKTDRFRVTGNPRQALALYLVAGLALMAFLFGTVHSRTAAEIKAYPSFQGYHEILQVWVEHGYLRHGGMAFKEPVSANPSQRIWRSNSLIFLQGALLLQRINYLFRGAYSYKVTALHNQAVIWLTAALLGLLAMRLAQGLGMPPDRAFMLGLANQAVYQTFPQNLQTYWELFPQTALMLVVVAWLLIEEGQIGHPLIGPWFVRLRALVIFLMVWVEPYGALLLLVGFVLALFLLVPEDRARVSLLRSVVVPAMGGVAIFLAQLLWVKLRYPGVTLWSTGLLERSGLDGSTQYVGGHWDLLTRKWPTPNLPVNSWKAVFLAGAIAFVMVVILRLVSRLSLKVPIFVLCVLLGLYVPFAFAAFQATAIHPYGFDVWLFVPLTLALFVILPAALEELTGHSGLLVFASIMAAWCFSWVQLRTYAMQFPLR